VNGDLSGNGFLDRISWSQLSKWIEFRRLHPIGEERDDLRIGALGSIIWNCNIDTRNGKDIKADKYIVGWGRDRNHVLRFHPERKDQVNGSNDQSLNNPAVWADFKANMKAAAKGKGIG
jgi:hypothetical protein